MLSVLGTQPFLKITLAEILILKITVYSWWFYCKFFVTPFMPASGRIAVCAVAINLSYALTANSKFLPTHTNIHLFINILSHTCSFMSSSLFAFISRTQPPLLLYTIVIPELTAAIFLLHVLGFNFFFFSKVTRS